LTLATSASPIKADALNFAKLNTLVDSYNIMTYDYTSGAWGDKYSGHDASVYSNLNDPLAYR